jgi:hypothetical protein
MGTIFKISNIRLCKAMNISLKIMIITRFEVLLREMQNLKNFEQTLATNNSHGRFLLNILINVFADFL